MIDTGGRRLTVATGDNTGAAPIFTLVPGSFSETIWQILIQLMLGQGTTLIISGVAGVSEKLPVVSYLLKMIVYETARKTLRVIQKALAGLSWPASAQVKGPLAILAMEFCISLLASS